MEFYLGGAPKYIMGISIVNDTLDVQIQDVIPRIYSVKTIHEMSVEDFIEEYYKAEMWDCNLRGTLSRHKRRYPRHCFGTLSSLWRANDSWLPLRL